MTAEQRLDRIERILDTLATNQINERDSRHQMREDLEILYQIVRQSTENQETAIAQLTVRVDQLTVRVDQLTVRVDQLAALMVQFAQNAETDRAEIRRIWEYLLSQYQNNGGGG